jgi:carbon storage regulator CsrA
MLVLSRKIGEQIQVGDNIRLTVVALCVNCVRLGIAAPADIRVLRPELDPSEKLSCHKESRSPVSPGS